VIPSTSSAESAHALAAAPERSSVPTAYAWDRALPMPGVHPTDGDNDMVVMEGISRSL
jgi:hypothetical protein